MKQTIHILFSILRSPLVIGSAISAIFYAMVHAQLVDHPFIDEYFAGHVIEYATTILFFIGLAALFNNVVTIARASSLVRPGRSTFDRILSESSLSIDLQGDGADLELAACGPIVERLDREVAACPNDKVARRVRDVLDRMVRSGSADHLNEELRYASDIEAERLYNEYALFRVVIWAIPILGFLGTVVGIAMAIANLSAEAMEQSLPVVVSSLGIAFATTIQALSLSIVLMFAKYLVSQAENRLAVTVDHAVERELLGRFQSIGDSPEGQLQAIRRMAETVVQASERLVRQQAQLWHASIEASEQRWAQVTATAGKQLETALVAALSKSLSHHAAELAKNEVALAEQHREYMDRFSEELQETVRSTIALEESVERQVLVLQRTVEATGQVARLEETLNRNLTKLAGANQFEQITTSLSAAIHLLNGRLVEVSPSNIQLDPPHEASSAA